LSFDFNHLTGQSRGFAFAQFLGIPDARRFLDRYYPSISLHGTYDPNNATSIEPTKIRIAYSRERDDRDKAGKSDDDWKCDVVCSLTLAFVALLKNYSATSPTSLVGRCAFVAMLQEQVCPAASSNETTLTRVRSNCSRYSCRAGEHVSVFWFCNNW
jgi:hypothetical protein